MSSEGEKTLTIAARDNDTLWAIARSYKTTAGRLMELNTEIEDLTPSRKLKAGTLIEVPEPPPLPELGLPPCVLPELQQGEKLLFPRGDWYKLKGLELKFNEQNPCRPGFQRHDRYKYIQQCKSTDQYFKLMNQTYKMKINEARQELKDFIFQGNVTGPAAAKMLGMCSVYRPQKRAAKSPPPTSGSTSTYEDSDSEDEAEQAAQAMSFLAGRPETRAAAVAADHAITVSAPAQEEEYVDLDSCSELWSSQETETKPSYEDVIAILGSDCEI